MSACSAPSAIRPAVSSGIVIDTAATPAPDYRLRRFGAAVVALCSLFIVTVAVSATADAVRGLGGRPAAASEAARDGSVRTGPAAPSTYVAAPGDTLWSIAQRFRGEVEIGRYVDALIDRNGGTTIRVGEAVVLP